MFENQWYREKNKQTNKKTLIKELDKPGSNAASLSYQQSLFFYKTEIIILTSYYHIIVVKLK